jgi:hypothetical protein
MKVVDRQSRSAEPPPELVRDRRLPRRGDAVDRDAPRLVQLANPLDHTVERSHRKSSAFNSGRP